MTIEDAARAFITEVLDIVPGELIRESNNNICFKADLLPPNFRMTKTLEAAGFKIHDIGVEATNTWYQYNYPGTTRFIVCVHGISGSTIELIDYH